MLFRSPELIAEDIVNNETPRAAGPISRAPTYSTYDPALDPGLLLGSGLQLGQSQPSPVPPPSPLPHVPSAADVPPGYDRLNIAEGNYGDSSDKLFSVYLSQAEKFDKESSESWKGDTEGILVFVRPPLNLLWLFWLIALRITRRLVFFLPRSPRSSSKATNSYNPTRMKQQFCSSRKSRSRLLPSPMVPPSPSHPRCPIRTSGPRHPQSG